MAYEPDFAELQHRYEDDLEEEQKVAYPAGVSHADGPVPEVDADRAESQDDEDDWLSEDVDYDIDAALDWAEAREGTACAGTQRALACDFDIMQC
jgi:hypothetical protein